MKIEQNEEVLKLLAEFEQRTDWNFADFDNRLGEIIEGATYQNAKPIIIEASESGKWPNTVRRYLCTNYALFGNVSAEFLTIFNKIYKELSESEKKEFGI